MGNGSEPTVASRLAVATGTTLKTLIQIATPATSECYPVAWGISFDGSAAGVPGIVELIETDVSATVTANTPTKFSHPAGIASRLIGGINLTGFTATVEGTIAVVRTADVQQIAPTSQYVYQWPLDRGFKVQPSKFLRIRVKFPVSVNAICWVQWEE